MELNCLPNEIPLQDANNIGYRPKCLTILYGFGHCLLLADRTNGRAYATVLRLCVCRLWRYVLWLNGAS